VAVCCFIASTRRFTRLGDLPSARFEVLFEIGAGLASSTNARLRSGQMKVVTSRSTEVRAEDELRVISKQLTRLVFRAQPLPRAASSPKNRSARHRAALSPS
jgi:hypothetical protein